MLRYYQDNFFQMIIFILFWKSKNLIRDQLHHLVHSSYVSKYHTFPVCYKYMQFDFKLIRDIFIRKVYPVKLFCPYNKSYINTQGISVI